MAALARTLTAFSVACAAVSVAATACSAYYHHKVTTLAADRHREAVEEASRLGEMRRRGQERQAALDKCVADQRNK